MTPPHAAYWAHLDRTNDTGLPVTLNSDGPVPHSFVTASHDLAMEWLRGSVRAALLDLGTVGFGVAWAWLGDHRAARRATAGLRQGHPVRFTVTTPAGHWAWSVVPIRALPLLAGPCPAPPSPSRSCVTPLAPSPSFFPTALI